MTGLFRTRERLKSSTQKSSYDVVIIGGGGHGLALAYYLAQRHGIRDVAVIERSYIGSGATGRNTTVLRANYKAPQTIPFFKASFELYRKLGAELDFNLLLSQRGLLWLAHSESSLRIQRERAFINQALGVDTVFVTPDEIAELCPVLDLDAGGKQPVLGAAYHSPGSIIRHDAVVWGYAAAAQQHGVHVHQGLEVTGINVDHGRCVGVETTRGSIAAGTVVSAVGGYVSRIAEMAGVRLPITTHPLQAFVTEAYKPVLDRIVASQAPPCLHLPKCAGGAVGWWRDRRLLQLFDTLHLRFSSAGLGHSIDLLPFMAKLRILRQWTGLCDMTPDYSPILGTTEVDRFFIDGGWGTWGFKAIPVAGVSMAELIATGRVPALIEPFGLERFRDDRVVPERASAGTH